MNEKNEKVEEKKKIKEIKKFFQKFWIWLKKKPNNWEDRMETETKTAKIGKKYQDFVVCDIDGKPKEKVAEGGKGRKHRKWQRRGWLLVAIIPQIFLWVFADILVGKILFSVFLSSVVGWKVFGGKKEKAEIEKGLKTKISWSVLSFSATLFISFLFLDNIVGNFQLAVYCVSGTAVFVWLVEEKTGIDLYPKSVGLFSLILFLVLSLLTINHIFKSGKDLAKDYSIPIEDKLREIELVELLTTTREIPSDVEINEDISDRVLLKIELASLKAKNNLPVEISRWNYLFNMISFLLSYCLSFFAFFLIASWEKVSGWFKKIGEKEVKGKGGKGGSFGDTLFAYFSIDGLTELVKTVFSKKIKRR